MSQYPSWLERWRLQALNNPQIDLFDEEQIEAHYHRFVGLYEKGGPAGVLLTEHPLTMCQRLLEILRPLGRGPTYASRIDGVSYRPWLWVRANQPQQILVSLHELMPPILWFAVGQSVADLYQKLDTIIEESVPSRYDFTHEHRAFMGTEAMLGVGLEGLRVHFSTNPFVSPLFWGSAHDDDPWPYVIDLGEELAMDESASEQMAQDPAAVQSLSMRTIASRSILTVEVHLGEVFVVQVSYDPADDAEQVRALNAQFGSHYPEDLPLDVVGALLGFYFEGETAIKRLVVESIDEEEMAFYVLLLTCVCHGDMGFVETLRSFLTHRLKPVRLAAAEVALHQGMRPLVWSRLFTEQDRPLRDRLIEQMLIQQEDS